MGAQTVSQGEAMSPVFGKVLLASTLALIAVANYYLASRLVGFDTKESLLIALISVVCTIGSWHP
jgi:hypothetical protein